MQSIKLALALLAMIALPARATISAVTVNCYPLGASGGTTTALNISSKTNVAIGVVTYSGVTGLSVSDSNSDALTGRTAQTSTEPNIRTYDFDFGGASGLSSYTVTVTGTNAFTAVCIIAWAGGKTSASFDAQDGNATNGAASITAATGFTPAGTGEILVSFLGIGPGSNTPSIGAGAAGDTAYSTPVCVSYLGSNYEGICASYWLQTTATNSGPKWSWVNSTQGVMTMDAYKPAPAGGAVIPRMTLLGVGP